MHLSSLLVLIPLLSTPALTTSKSFPYCKNDYAPTNSRCSPFRSKPPAKTPGSIDLTRLPRNAPLPVATRHLIEVITNVFENGETEFGYANVEHLDDGRGYTVGRVGFCTGTGDALAVVNRYTDKKPNNSLATYLPELRRLDKLPSGDTKRGSIKNLAGFAAAWKQSALDPAFRQIQDLVTEEMYLTPSGKLAASVNVHSALGQAIFYDSAVQHGWEDPRERNCLPAIMRITGPRGSEEEAGYLARFLDTRRKMLCCTKDDVWPESADRVSDLQRLVNAGSLGLQEDIVLKAYDVTIKGVAGSKRRKSGRKE